MDKMFDLPDDVDLVHRFPLDGKREVHVYVEPYSEDGRADVCLAYIRDDGSVASRGMAIGVPLTETTLLLTAAAFLASVPSAFDREMAAAVELLEAWGLDPGAAKA